MSKATQTKQWYTYVEKNVLCQYSRVPIPMPIKFSLYFISMKTFDRFLKNLHPQLSTTQSKCPIGPQNGCGSCPLSVYDYKTQLYIKKQFIKHLNNIYNIHLPLKDIESSPVTTHYRNKMEYAIMPKGIGLRPKGKWWKVLDKHTCFLAHPTIETTFNIAHNLLASILKSGRLTAYNRKTHQGILRYLTIKASKQSRVVVSLTLSDPNVSQFNNLKLSPKTIINLLQQEFIRPLTKQLKAKRITLRGVIIKYSKSISDVSYGTTVHIEGKNILEEMLHFKHYKTNVTLKIKLAHSSDTFFQTNMYLYNRYIEILQYYLSKSIRNSNTQITLIDLYSGVGFLSIPLIKIFDKHIKNAVSVEEITESTKFAQHNLKQNNISNSIVLTERVDNVVEQVFSQYGNLKETLPIVIVDPSRAGLGKKVLKALTKFKPYKLIYVSCNIIQFADEYKRVLQKYYTIEDALYLDNFPQTPYFESFFLLNPI